MTAFLYATVKSIVPAPLMQYLRDRRVRLAREPMFCQIEQHLAGGPQPRQALDRLAQSWANLSHSADHELLTKAAWLAARSSGPILECGSGLSTLILGRVAQRRGLVVWSLEHLPAWRERVAVALRQQRIRGARVCLAELVDHGGYEWYRAPSPAEMPGPFSLVFCDGPPGKTKGGRYGLLPVMRDRLASGCTILLDDAGREGERQLLDRWKREYGVAVALEGSERPFAVVKVP